MEGFGVIVVCTKKDYLFAKGCCASVRHFMGDVPLCLLVHGDFDYHKLASTYKASVINYNTIQSPLLKARSFGWGVTKMIAFWESPFEHFLLLDADTCLWGDMTKYAEELNTYDVIVDKPGYSYTEDEVSHWFIDVKRIKEIYPDFHPAEHPYVCTGIIFSKKNIFTIDEYMEMLDLAEKNPGLFFPGEMGFFNFMIYYAKEKGRLKVGNEDVQYLVCDFKPEEMKKTFPLNGKPVLTKEPTVLHFTGGIKPIKYKKLNHYTEPAMFFRRKYLEDIGIKGILATAILKFEDLQWTYRTQKPYYKKRIRKLFG
jgi:hypothetical protein